MGSALTSNGKPPWLRRRQIPERSETVEILLDGATIMAGILDRSAEGIRLRLACSHRLPAWMYLRFEDGEIFPVERRWQHADEAGFVFALEYEVAHLVSEISDDECSLLMSLIELVMEGE